MTTHKPRYYLSLSEFFDNLNLTMLEELIDTNISGKMTATKSKHELGRRFITAGLQKGLRSLLELCSRDLLVTVSKELNTNEENEVKRSAIEESLFLEIENKGLALALSEISRETLDELCAVFDFEEQGTKEDVEGALIEEILIAGAKIMFENMEDDYLVSVCNACNLNITAKAPHKQDIVSYLLGLVYPHLLDDIPPDFAVLPPRVVVETKDVVPPPSPTASVQTTPMRSRRGKKATTTPAPTETKEEVKETPVKTPRKTPTKRTPAKKSTTRRRILPNTEEEEAPPPVEEEASQVEQETVEEPSQEATPSAPEGKPEFKLGVTYDELFQAYFLPELKEYCRSQGLRHVGNRRDLIKRILAHLAGAPIPQTPKRKRKSSSFKPRKKTPKKTATGISEPNPDEESDHSEKE